MEREGCAGERVPDGAVPEESQISKVRVQTKQITPPQEKIAFERTQKGQTKQSAARQGFKTPAKDELQTQTLEIGTKTEETPGKIAENRERNLEFAPDSSRPGLICLQARLLLPKTEIAK